MTLIKIRCATLLDTHQLKAYKASKVLNLLTLPTRYIRFFWAGVVPINSTKCRRNIYHVLYTLLFHGQDQDACKRTLMESQKNLSLDKPIVAERPYSQGGSRTYLSLMNRYGSLFEIWVMHR